MTDDQFWRGIITTISTVLIWLIFSKPRKTGAKREERRPGTADGLSQRLRALWTRTDRTPKN